MPDTDTAAGDQQQTDETQVDEASSTAANRLGDAGQKALSEERSARKAAEKAAKTAQDELDRIRVDSMSEQEKAVAAAKAEGKQEALAMANDRLLRAEIKSAAVGKLADPGDALGLLDLGQFSVDDNGNVDTKAISDAIDRLVKAKPYLGPRAKPGPLPGGGATPSNGFSMDDWMRDQVSNKQRA